MARPGRERSHLRAAPGLDDDARAEIGPEQLVPTDHDLAIAREDFAKAVGEIGLPRLVVGQAVRCPELPDRSAGVPVRPVDLVAPDVEVTVCEETTHLAVKFGDEGIDLFAGRVEGVIHGSRARRRLDARAQLRIRLEPAASMAGGVELGNDAHAVIGGVVDHVAHFGLSVVAIAGLLELREQLALDPEALVVAQMKVQDIELDQLHGVDLALQRAERLEMTRRSDTSPAQAVART